MWLDRFSGNSTPSGSPPRQGRAYSPAPIRRSSHLVPTLPLRPGVSPRSSSLALALTPNTSTSSLPATARNRNGSALKQTLSPPLDIRDPLDVLHDIVGSLPEKNAVTARSLGEEPGQGKPFEVDADVDFGGLGLKAFAETCAENTKSLRSIGQKSYVQPVDDCS